MYLLKTGSHSLAIDICRITC